MNLEQKLIHLVGYASGIGGARVGSADAPDIFKHSAYFSQLKEHGIDTQWEKIIATPSASLPKLQLVTQQCRELANTVHSLVLNKKFFTVIGGDHTSAIGTWSGVYQAIHHLGSLGLIWIDAHMDSHTPKTTLTGNIHGMPLACLLEQGYPELTQLGVAEPKIKPTNLCLIGIRSFEPAEADLLESLNVKIFMMSEVKRRGLRNVMQEAIHHVTKHTSHFGVSIDVDSIDPSEAPGTGVPAPDGLSAQELRDALTLLAGNKQLVGVEMVEFDPHLDKDHKTEKILFSLITAMIAGK